MAKHNERIWSGLRPYDNRVLLEDETFKAMMDAGWVCTFMAWRKDNVEENEKYPQNIFDDIKKMVTHIDWPEIISEDNIKGLEYVINLLDEQAQTLLELRYKKGLTLEVIGKIYELTGERVRQLIYKALRSIARDYDKVKIIKFGLNNYINRETISRNGLEITYCASCGKEMEKQKCRKEYESEEEFKKRQLRIASSNKINIMIHKPEYGVFHNLLGENSFGMSILASVSNITVDTLSLKIEDFYIVEEGKRIPPGSKIINVSFNDTILIPGETRDTGLVWENEGFNDFYCFEYNSKIVISVRINDESKKRVYTFSWDKESSSFSLEDLYFLD